MIAERTAADGSIERVRGVATLGALIIHELTTDAPIVDLRVFKERSYAAGVFLMTSIFSSISMQRAHAASSYPWITGLGCSARRRRRRA